MRLGTRLTLAFLIVAFVPAGAVLTFTWFTVEERFGQEFNDRLDGVAEGIRNDLQKIGRRIQQKVQALSETEGIERILVDMVRGKLDWGALCPQAVKWMKPWDLDLLTIMDGTGTVLSSGHLPARCGGNDDATYRMAIQKPMKPAIRKVQVLRGGSIEEILAVVVGGTRKFNQAEVVIVGGMLLDEKFIGDLENLSGARIHIVDVDDRLIAGEQMQSDDPKAPWVGEQEVAYRRIALPPGEEKEATAFVMAGVSATKLMDAQRRIVIASVGAAIVGVFISWLLGLLISRRILGPVNDLVNGARFIAKGELDHRVPYRWTSDRSGGEIGELVRTFNRMIGDLDVYRRRLVRAERVAAWQEIARRIAHEIKNPLSPIQMSIETLRKAYSAGHSDFKEIFEESTRAILEEVAALKRIVTEFTEFARLPKPTLIVQDLIPVVENTVNLYRNEPKGNRIEISPIPQLPPVAIDREQIGRLLANLLSNALWASGGEGWVRINISHESGQVLLQVVDQGCGMPPEIVEKVFTPYFTTRKDGTGLGLAIVQRIAEEHDGSIEIESAEDQGTTVTLSLPVARM